MRDISSPIGIFDSGIGGLTVLKEVAKQMPFEDIVYLGDTARVPYGIRSEETVIRYAIENTEFLLTLDIKMIIVACNTVSAVGLAHVAEIADVPVVGVIKPGAEAAVRASRNMKIGVIGTEATVQSSAYHREIKALAPHAEVFARACPLFVPLVEEGWIEGEIATLVVKEYLRGLQETGIDTLVLGCTHYPLLKGTISSVMGDSVTLIDSAIETARVSKHLLESNGLLRKSNPSPRRRFYVTDSPERFRHLGEKFLGSPLELVEKIELPVSSSVILKNREEV
jgi:glutamate racemase